MAKHPLYFFIMNILVFVFAQEHPSIHKIQLEYYNKNYIELPRQDTRESIINKYREIKNKLCVEPNKKLQDIVEDILKST